MVLVDTSVWIRFLSNTAPYASELDRLLSLDSVIGHPFVYGELLIGDKGGRKRFLQNYELIQQAPLIDHSEVVAFVMSRRLNGRGIGWVDTHLLASAVVGRFELWTIDPRFHAAAEELRIAYRPNSDT